MASVDHGSGSLLPTLGRSMLMRARCIVRRMSRPSRPRRPRHRTNTMRPLSRWICAMRLSSLTSMMVAVSPWAQKPAILSSSSTKGVNSGCAISVRLYRLFLTQAIHRHLDTHAQAFDRTSQRADFVAAAGLRDGYVQLALAQLFGDVGQVVD